MEEDTFIVIQLGTRYFRITMKDKSNTYLIEEKAAYVFDKSNKLIAWGEEAREKYDNPGLFTRKKNLSLLDFEWMQRNKIKYLLNPKLRCPDQKAVGGVDSLAAIFTHLMPSELLEGDKQKERRITFTVCVGYDFPFQALEKIREATQKTLMGQFEVHILREVDAAFSSFARLFDRTMPSADNFDGEKPSKLTPRPESDSLIVAAIEDGSCDFYVFQKNSDRQWYDAEHKMKSVETLSRVVIEQCLERLLTSIVDKELLQEHSDDREALIKQLSGTNLLRTKDIRVPVSLIQEEKIVFTFDEIYRAFESVQDIISEIASSASGQTQIEEMELPIDIIVLGGFHCLTGLDIPGVQIHTGIDIVSGCVEYARNRQGPLKIHLDIDEEKGYSCRNGSPHVVVLEIDKMVDSEIIQNMPDNERDDVWSESQIIQVMDNRPYLRFYEGCQIQQPLNITFKLLETCGKEDRIYHLNVWSNEWEIRELIPKGKVLEFDVYLNSIFYLTSICKVTEAVLTSSEDLTYKGNDELCSVKFNAGCISTDTKIKCMVVGVRINEMKKADNLSIISITKGIHINIEGCHKLNNAVLAQMPFVNLDDEHSERLSEGSPLKTCLFRITDDCDTQLHDLNDDNFEIQNGCIQVPVDGFSTVGAALCRADSRNSVWSDIRKGFNGKTGYRILTLLKPNIHDIEVWFAIFETEKYVESRKKFLKEDGTKNFMEITASNYSEVFLKDGWKLRFFITSGAKNVSNAYMKFIGRSNHNRKLIRIKRTNQKPAFAECRVLKSNARGKHDELLTFPFDMPHAVKPAETQGPWVRAKLPSLESSHEVTKGWLNDKIIRDLARELHKNDVWQLGIGLELTDPELSHIEEECGKDITRCAYKVLQAWKRKRRSDLPENFHVKFLEEQLDDIGRNDLEQALHDGFHRKSSKLFDK